MIDLHCHSLFSDGVLSPDDLLKKALESNVKILALTDHDTSAGLELLQKAAEGKPIKIINGIELSAKWKKYGIHILGLNIDYNNESLFNCIVEQQMRRKKRAMLIGEQLNTLGIPDTYEKACLVAGHETVGRPHFAQVLINEGKVKDFKSAFSQFLGQNHRHKIPKTCWLSMEEVIKAIKDSGGSSVLAHPFRYRLTRFKLNELIKEFKTCGGDGIEVVSGNIMPHEINEAANLCARYELLASTGSDFHGDTVSRVGLGEQKKMPELCSPIWKNWDI